MQVKSTEVFNQLLSTNDLYQYTAPAFTNTIWPIQTARISALPIHLPSG